jgi:alkaline phosphatase D
MQKNYTRFLLLLGLINFWHFTQLHSQINHAARSALSPALKPFYHGVASGDPTSESVIIWTRCTPDTGMAGDLDVYWQVATDTLFSQVVNYGYAKAKPENDYTVKVDVCGLQPNTWYYYVFQHNGRNSVTGRTRTAPAQHASNDSARFAVVSCADYDEGFFNAYENIVNRNDVDAVIHLGDYIYEYGESGGNNRILDPPTEVISLNDYRIRHSLYKLDFQLRRCHQAFPFIAVWDDHETANNSWRDGAENHQPNEGPWNVRKQSGVNAYFEWMPLRRPDWQDTFRIFRNFRWGKLMNLAMLDSRLYDRDEQDGNKRNDPNHKLLGPVQMQWLLHQLSDTLSKWKIIGNQVMFAPLTVFGAPVNNDQWDGYAAERNRVTSHILNNNIQNVVILTGDIHTVWANDIPGANYNPSTGANSVAVEFVGPSVTSANSPLPVGVNLIRTFNPHAKYINLDNHGYYLLDVKKNRVQADYIFTPIQNITANSSHGESWFVNAGERFLRKAGSPVAAPKISAPLPSPLPNHFLPFVKIERNIQATTLQNQPKIISVIPHASVCPSIFMQLLQQPVYGNAVLINGREILYTPLTNYSGPDTMVAIVCETLQPNRCDTICVAISVIPYTYTDTFLVNISGGTVYSHCRGFNDLFGSVAPAYLTGTFNGAALLNNDSCLIYTPLHGFCGYEHVYVVQCETTTHPKCDSVLYLFRVNLPLVKDVLNFTLRSSDTIHYCIRYNELYSGVTSSQVLVQPQVGTIHFKNDTCFAYHPPSTATQDVVVVTGCDNCTVKNCDTVEIRFRVVPQFTTQTFTFFGTGGTSIPVCFAFDEVNRPFNSVKIQSSGSAMVQILSDTCFNYITPAGYTGIDTVYVIACSPLAPNHCDTVRLIMYVGISPLKNEEEFAMLGIYPHPFSDGLLVQFFSYLPGTVACILYDASGRKVKEHTVSTHSTGLQHIFLHTENIPSGTYLLELKDYRTVYRRKIVRQ